MPGPKPLCVTLTAKQRELLAYLIRRQTSSQRLVRRAQTIVAAADGASNASIAARLSLDRNTVRTWRQRWWSGADALAAAEAAGDADKALRLRMEGMLDDAPRPGTPGDFSAEQLAHIISVACESPEDAGRPVSHWTPRELAETLIANFEVATGQVLAPSLGPTRTEEDFANHIAKTIATDPEAQWIFVMDQLHIHTSEALGRLVAKHCALDVDLGVKGKSGIMQSMATRAAFLQDQTHRIRVVYTPKHTSWLNQVEMWFSILARRVLKRASFTSVEDLRDRVLAFIAYCNTILAKPFKWTYKGRPLSA